MKPIDALVSLLAAVAIVAGPVRADPSPAAEKPASTAAPGKSDTGSPAKAASAGVKATAPAEKAVPVPAAATPAAPVIVVNVPPQPAPAPPPEPANNWGAGLIGIAILAGGIFFGLRYVRGKGVTVATSLKQLGVELPQDGAVAATPISHLRPPAATVQLPPLRSLSDLPEPVEDATIMAGPMPTPAYTPRPSNPIPPSGASLLGLAGPIAGERITLGLSAGEPLTIGREQDNAVQLLGDSTVSRYHARVLPPGDGSAYSVVDQGSSNGTWVNGEKLSAGEPHALRPGDEIQVGSTRMRFEAGAR